MASYESGRDLVDDVLFRAGEPTDGSSDFNAKALEFVNRAYLAICAGGAELDPEGGDEVWSWLKAYPPKSFTLSAPGHRTVTLTSGDEWGVFTGTPPTGSFGSGWFMRVDGDEEWYRIAEHDTGASAFAMDQPWIGSSGTYTAELRKYEYFLDVEIHRIISPMRFHRYSNRFIEAAGYDQVFQMGFEVGLPTHFTMIGDQRIRLSHSVPLDHEKVRIEYDYLLIPGLLSYASTAIPYVPRMYRHIIADAALMYLYMSKNDTRYGDMRALVQAGIMAMKKENRAKKVHYSRNFGRLIKRGTNKGPLRTETGLIIG